MFPLLGLGTILRRSCRKNGRIGPSEIDRSPSPSLACPTRTWAPAAATSALPGRARLLRWDPASGWRLIAPVVRVYPPLSPPRPPRALCHIHGFGPTRERSDFHKQQELTVSLLVDRDEAGPQGQPLSYQEHLDAGKLIRTPPLLDARKHTQRYTHKYARIYTCKYKNKQRPNSKAV